MSAVLRNTYYSAITLGLRFISNAILFIFIARVLGVEEFGRLSFSISLTSIFLVIIDYGFNVYIVKEMSASPHSASSIAGAVASGKALLVVLSTISIMAFLNYINCPMDTVYIVMLLWLSVIFYSYGYFYNSMFRSFSRFEYELYPNLLLNITQIVLVTFFLYFGYGSISIAIAYLVSRILYSLYSSYLVNSKICGVTILPNFITGINIIKKTIHYGIHAIISTLYFQVDTVMLSYFKGNVEVGYYQASMRIVLASMIICEVVTTSFFPVIARYYNTDKEVFLKYCYILNKYLILTGGSIALGLLLFNRQIIGLFYGTNYGPSVSIMQLLAIVVLLRFVGGGYAVLITIYDEQKLRAMGVAMSLVVNIALNVVLIPKYGVMGASVVSIITHMLLVILYAIFASRLVGKYLITKHTFLGSLVLIVGGIICWALTDNKIEYLVSSYSIIMVILLIVSSSTDERQKLKHLVLRYF